MCLMDAMKREMKDILETPELRKMPFRVPEGYFPYLKDRAMGRCRQNSARSGHLRYVALAATFLLLVAAGGFFLERQNRDTFTEEDYIVFSDEMVNTIYDTYSEQYADIQDPTQEDIIEYLIYIGVDIEDFESLFED